ncbi:hypothetical protein HY045_03580 [Candidatus Woesebacteria bacterium]|nr:hypothetical protein [Candidatus Woesebacteria bacterium]
MRKIIFAITFLVLMAISVSKTSAQVNTLCAYCPDLRPQCSGHSGNQVGGEFFQCRPGSINPSTGRGTFTICKNENCDNFSNPKQLDYEKYEFDGNGIYLVEEGLWAGGKGINRCSDGSIAYNRRFAENGTPGIRWLPTNLNVGDTFQQVGRVQGYSTSTRAECTTGPDPAQQLDSRVGVTYKGCIQFANGNWTNNGVILSVTSGAGAGENFYFDTNRGWIGFDRGDNNGNYSSTQLDSGPPPVGCRLVGGGARPILPPPLITPVQCNASNPGTEGVSRPIPCSDGTCNQTRYKIPSCASSFAVGTGVPYRDNEASYFCENNPWIERTWTGTVTVDASDTKIPFVGKSGQESREKYLADYLEGTCPFYHGNGTNDCVEQKDPKKKNSLTKDVGVWQMLSPKDIQDKYKKDMVERAKKTLAGGLPEGGVHNYIVGSNFGVQKKLSEMKLPPVQPPLNLSDAGSIANFAKWVAEYATWKTEFGNLWSYVPMFSREDTPGKIVPYLGSRPLDKFVFQKPENQVEKVPHLARLFEVSKAVENLMLPNNLKSLAVNPEPKSNLAVQTSTKTKTSKVEKKNILLTFLGTAKNKVASIFDIFKKNVVYAQANPGTCPTQFSVAIENVRTGDDGMMHYGIRIIHTAPGVIGDVLVNPQYGIHWANIPPEGVYYDTDYHGATSFLPLMPAGTNPDSIVTVLDIRSQPGYEAPDGCQRTLTFAGGAKGVTPTPKPLCGLPDPRGVASCEEPARKDTNPNDSLCCNPININLSATDTFINSNYNPNSAEIEIESLKRQIGVVLIHPYLDQIWLQLNSPTEGLFNVFRPKDSQPFDDKSAASSIKYGFSGGSISQTEGNFYFPLLGGIQSAKEWISEIVFTPFGYKVTPGVSSSATTPGTRGQTCNAIGGTCKTACTPSETDQGAKDCYQGGVVGGQTCCAK